VVQFIALFNAVKGLANEDLYWGDELEYGVIEVVPGDEKDGSGRTVKLALCGDDLRAKLQGLEATRHNRFTNGCAWHQVPTVPYRRRRSRPQRTTPTPPLVATRVLLRRSRSASKRTHLLQPHTLPGVWELDD
jgi:hypothetical protein